jgi:hypothetical protein
MAIWYMRRPANGSRECKCFERSLRRNGQNLVTGRSRPEVSGRKAAERSFKIAENDIQSTLNVCIPAAHSENEKTASWGHKLKSHLLGTDAAMHGRGSAHGVQLLHPCPWWACIRL